ncbi:transmembrane protease serine 2-like [Clytia hemisphaerica]|uniref:Peptidase S1 domain-containing protein n=1 Tax=Clytia hemisphaerica TaxID=252671 RepID=A0A7M5XED8_9CNID
MLRLAFIFSSCWIVACYACSDTDEDCGRFKDLCGVNSYVDKHCVKSCERCGGEGGATTTTTTASPGNGNSATTSTATTHPMATKVPCVDNDPDCPGLVDLCGINSYVDKYCLKTCPEACKKLNNGDGDGGESQGNKNAKCGVSKVSQPRVVNGVEAQPGAWPWIISLQTVRGSHFCGGSILTPTWILTASHCVKKYKDIPGFFMIVAGAHDKELSEHSQQRIEAKRIIVHPEYGRYDEFSADIALIQLETPLRLNDRVVKACMPQQGVYPKVG